MPAKNRMPTRKKKPWVQTWVALFNLPTGNATSKNFLVGAGCGVKGLQGVSTATQADAVG